MSDIFGGEGQENHASEHEAGGDDPVTDLAPLTSDLDISDNGLRQMSYLFGGSDGTTFIHTNGSGTGYIEVVDDANNNTLISFNEGGLVRIPNGDLDIAGNTLIGANATAQYITKRYQSGNGNTGIYWDEANSRFQFYYGGSPIATLQSDGNFTGSNTRWTHFTTKTVTGVTAGGTAEVALDNTYPDSVYARIKTASSGSGGNASFYVDTIATGQHEYYDASGTSTTATKIPINSVTGNGQGAVAEIKMSQVGLESNVSVDFEQAGFTDLTAAPPTKGIANTAAVDTVGVEMTDYAGDVTIEVYYSNL